MNQYCIKIVILLLPLIALGYCEQSSDNSYVNNISENNKNQSKYSTTTNQQHSIKNSQHYVSDMQELSDVVSEYVDDILKRDTINLLPGIAIQKKINTSDEAESRTADKSLISKIQQFTNNHVLTVNLARASTATGRLFFFKGLKKFMWPLFIGFQVVKTALLVLFLPSIIGSVGKIAAKGLPSLSGTISQFSQFSNPNQNAHVEQVDDLEFKDNSGNVDSDPEGTLNSVYQYAIPDMKNNFASQMYESAQANNAITRLGLDKVEMVEKMKTTGFSSKKDDFKIFHDIPSSSHLLMNYDPFYSPLLSRLDTIFQQLGLGAMSDEKCRAKLVCLMYSNPAKYAPYSNLVSAQLSRELNELRKPTSDNPDILRFFRYMRAAKDGQDGMECEIAYKECLTFNDMSGPAMINTYNDINKLVQARKLSV
ncbi:unnamed protein product [Chironomus riparius]|uniref:Uncharacterized protein n=1 Tax=Chironomus riparius TaxID=315576 RepID=A0A9N9S415_9DIPT|nr:unnamed protein product [Chironomus riparius]